MNEFFKNVLLFPYKVHNDNLHNKFMSYLLTPWNYNQTDLYSPKNIQYDLKKIHLKPKGQICPNRTTILL